VTRHRPFPLVLAAPSGAGKTSLARALVARNADVVFSLSATTRPPRAGETHDIDYFFVDDAGFEDLIGQGELLEWATVHGRRYGTLRRGIDRALDAGYTVVLDIDVQGARLIRDTLHTLPDAVLVFILPPSVGEMVRRLQERASESAQELATRMRTARAELDAVADFDYVIVNDDFDDALRTIEAILTAEAFRVMRQAALDRTLTAMRNDIDAMLTRS
jgi:guanylate kinase